MYYCIEGECGVVGTYILEGAKENVVLYIYYILLSS